jgi:hypothetical protein
MGVSEPNHLVDIRGALADGPASRTHHHLLLKGSVVDGSIVGGVHTKVGVLAVHGWWSKGCGGLVPCALPLREPLAAPCPEICVLGKRVWTRWGGQYKSDVALPWLVKVSEEARVGAGLLKGSCGRITLSPGMLGLEANERGGDSKKRAGFQGERPARCLSAFHHGRLWAYHAP